ncbi:MAG: hypothetical protein LAT84_04525 [Balneolia bacterium]|nr:hypothetical protein [Balneolia bacterium]
MKKSVFTYFSAALLSLFLITGLSVQNAEAQNRPGGNFGLGVMLGEPTGVTGKLWTGGNTAFAGGVAWSFSGRSSLHMHLDYQINNFNLIQVERGTMSFYYGLGGRFLIREDRDDKLGVRIPLGLSYFFSNDPIELFMEVAPVLDLAPSTDFSANGGIGVRYYF